ncbi:MAG: hypothetical protein H7Y13_09780 [Sphingobacteriaceae bacterium]|nr:hypothetical protein [Sphingobacteriaceae bacterium]
MKTIKYGVVVICFLLSITFSSNVEAQCSMCTLNAENSVQHGNHQGKNLNKGILYLLAMPYLAVGLIGFIWYKKYRKKDILVDVKDGKLID